MNDIGNKYALAALKDKRASLAGEISQLKKQLSWRQEQIAHVDATLRLFDPSAKPETIPTKRPYKHVKLFKQGELGRTIVDALRRAAVPLKIDELTASVTAALNQPDIMRSAMKPRVRGNLAYLHGIGKVFKTGSGTNAKWALVAPHEAV